MDKVTAKFWCPNCGYRIAVSKLKFLNNEVNIDTTCPMCFTEIICKVNTSNIETHCPVCGELNIPTDIKLSEDNENNQIVTCETICTCGNECTIIFKTLELPSNWFPPKNIS